MFKKLLIFLVLFFNFSLVNAQNIPNSIISTIDGDTLQLNQFKGKKLLIIVLPSGHATEDSLALIAIEQMYEQYGDSIAFLGIPFCEDGCNETDQEKFKWYRQSLHLTFPIALGLITKKTSGKKQSEIFQWLSSKSSNGHFNYEISNCCYKFLLQPGGQIGGVFSETIKLNNKLMKLILKM